MPLYLTMTSAVHDPIVLRLRELRHQRPELIELACVYEAILPIVRDADLPVSEIPLSREQALEKMANGLPLLSGVDLAVDVDAVRQLMIKLAGAMENVRGNDQPFMFRLPWFSSAPASDSAVHRIRRSLEQNTLNVGELLVHTAGGDDSAIRSEVSRLDLDRDLLRTITQHALKPALRVWSRQFASLGAGATWTKDLCFVCGANAALAELQGNDQEKHARCGSCGSDWTLPRLQCALCGNTDYRTVTHVYAGDKRERMHLEACDKCRGYLKVIAAFSPTPAEMLAVEDLATLHLDYIAQERGYRAKLRPPSYSTFPIGQ